MQKPLTLNDIALARSGDKGDKVNIGLFAKDATAFELIRSKVTTTALKRHFELMPWTDIEVHEVRKIMALNIVFSGALPGGGPESLRVDNLAKTMASALLRMQIS
ncbi:hypothetical protein [Cupriavidus necator]|uniref:AtuA-related protein n=1 Tax=Cupriavidus necator TaxID=106590 RepID=UPI0005B44B0B|nr:hypothetical protein [Cupriavidus necator]